MLAGLRTESPSCGAAGYADAVNFGEIIRAGLQPAMFSDSSPSEECRANWSSNNDVGLCYFATVDHSVNF